MSAGRGTGMALLLTLVLVVVVVVALVLTGAPSRARRAVAWSLAILFGLPLLAGVGFFVYLGTEKDGDKVANAGAEAAAAEIADHLELSGGRERAGGRELTGEELALLVDHQAADLELRRELTGENRHVEVLLLGWSTGEETSVDLRVEQYSPRQSDGGGEWPPRIFSRYTSEGHAVRCWRLTAHHGKDAALDELDCPEGPPVRAVPAGSASLGTDPGGAITGALASVSPDADEETVGKALRAALPLDESPGTVQYRVQRDRRADALIVAVGLTNRRECVVVVREPAGDPFVFADYTESDLGPSETGCSTALYPSASQVEHTWTRNDLPGAPPTPSTAPPSAPNESPASASDPESEELLLQALAEFSPDVDETTALAELEGVFPRYRVEVRREGDEVVASVMGPGHRDCLVGVRSGTETPVRFTDFPRVQLELGELGCSPGLYWSGVTAH